MDENSKWQVKLICGWVRDQDSPVCNTALKHGNEDPSLAFFWPSLAVLFLGGGREYVGRWDVLIPCYAEPVCHSNHFTAPLLLQLPTHGPWPASRACVGPFLRLGYTLRDDCAGTHPRSKEQLLSMVEI